MEKLKVKFELNKMTSYCNMIHIELGSSAEIRAPKYFFIAPKLASGDEGLIPGLVPLSVGDTPDLGGWGFMISGLW